MYAYLSQEFLDCSFDSLLYWPLDTGTKLVLVQSPVTIAVGYREKRKKIVHRYSRHVVLEVLTAIPDFLLFEFAICVGIQSSEEGIESGI